MGPTTTDEHTTSLISPVVYHSSSISTWRNVNINRCRMSHQKTLAIDHENNDRVAASMRLRRRQNKLNNEIESKKRKIQFLQQRESAAATRTRLRINKSDSKDENQLSKCHAYLPTDISHLFDCTLPLPDYDSIPAPG